MLLIRTSPNEPFAEPAVTTHPNEAELQAQIMKRPSLLPMQPSLAVVDEFGISGVGRVDILGVAPDGRIWIVECKLAANPEIRREIVGQVLAYAGGLWQMSYDDFASRFAARNKGTSLHVAVQQAAGADVDPELLTDGVTQCLNSGAFTLVLAVDSITEELKRIVEFLDRQTTPEVRVMALEMSYYKQGPVEVLSPVTYGDQFVQSTKPAGGANKWTEQAFVAALQAVPDTATLAVLSAVLDHGRQNGRHPFWGSGNVPGMSYYYDVSGKDCPVWAMYLRPAGATVAVSFGSIAHVSEGRALAVLAALQAIPEVAPFIAAVAPGALNRYPNIPATALTVPGVLQAFLAALDKATI